jgi:hypothetical protein
MRCSPGRDATERQKAARIGAWHLVSSECPGHARTPAKGHVRGVWRGATLHNAVRATATHLLRYKPIIGQHRMPELAKRADIRPSPRSFHSTSEVRIHNQKPPRGTAQTIVLHIIFWLRGQDLNLRPSGYEPMDPEFH